MNVRRYAQALGRRGGQARARNLSSREKKKIASLGGKARALSHHAAKRIERNFHGVQAIRKLRKPSKVRSVGTTSERLPGIYVQHHRLS